MKSVMRITGFGLTVMASLLATGCAVGISGWSGCSGNPNVWVEAQDELRIDDTAVKIVRVKTHNGRLVHTGRDAVEPGIVVAVSKRAGGATQADAEEAMASISVYSEPGSNGVQKIGWKWRVTKKKNWRAQVSFNIDAPSDISFDGQTHNGRVTVTGVVGDVRIVTHNGRVVADAQGGALYAKTHNGRIEAVYTGDDVTLATHNGRITADLSGCAALDGAIRTHNGRIAINLGRGASAKLACKTHNGKITAEMPIEQIESGRRRLSGVIGGGDGELKVTTHNGSIDLRRHES